MNIAVEVVGISATVLIFISMMFKTTSVVGSIWMRALNIAGSIAFLIYGILLPAIATAVLNGALVIVNTYHLVMLIINYKKDKAHKTSEKLDKPTNEKN